VLLKKVLNFGNGHCPTIFLASRKRSSPAMKNKNDLGMLAGLAATIIGFLGLIRSTIELIIYQIQNPDFTEMRVFIENPHLIIWTIVFAVMFDSGWETVQHYKNNGRK
jgi:hypothetical protein